MTDNSPHPDDLVHIQISMTFQAETTVTDHPVDVPTEYSYCLPCEEDTADYLESIAIAIRERRAFGFMQQEIAALPLGTGEWVQPTLSGDDGRPSGETLMYPGSNGIREMLARTSHPTGWLSRGAFQFYALFALLIGWIAGLVWFIKWLISI